MNISRSLWAEWVGRVRGLCARRERKFGNRAVLTALCGAGRRGRREEVPYLADRLVHHSRNWYRSTWLIGAKRSAPRLGSPRDVLKNGRH